MKTRLSTEIYPKIRRFGFLQKPAYRRINSCPGINLKEVEVLFPVIEDLKMEVAKKYGMVQPNASTTQAVRAVFIIDPQAKYYPLSNGRNMDEIKRLVIALQKTDRDGIATPANWQPGEDVIILPPGSCGSAKERVESQEEGKYCLDWFICFKKDQ
jgi:peroxiredoxin (alkyl hydroperoxide reductase subunit C)